MSTTDTEHDDATAAELALLKGENAALRGELEALRDRVDNSEEARDRRNAKMIEQAFVAGRKTGPSPHATAMWQRHAERLAAGPEYPKPDMLRDDKIAHEQKLIDYGGSGPGSTRELGRALRAKREAAEREEAGE